MATKSIEMNIKINDDKVIDKICDLFEKNDKKKVVQEKNNKFNVINSLKNFNI